MPNLEAAEPVSRAIRLQHGCQTSLASAPYQAPPLNGARPNPNLPLAARPRVGHIRPNGAVAEWLKAAVC